MTRKPVDLDPPTRPTDYAPPAIRKTVEAEETTVEQISALTNELDQFISDAEGDLRALKIEMQEVRDTYARDTKRVVEDIRRLQESVRVGMQSMKTLREHCAKITNGVDTVP